MKKNNALFLITVLCGWLMAAQVAFGTLTSKVQITFSSLNEQSRGLTEAQDRVFQALTRRFDNGSGTTQVADLVYHSERTLSGNASETLNLVGTLTDSFGTILTFARVKALVIENTSASMTLTLGGENGALPFVTPATGSLYIPPSGLVSLVAPLDGYPIASGSLITVTNASGSATIYKIWILGSSN